MADPAEITIDDVLERMVKAAETARDEVQDRESASAAWDVWKRVRDEAGLVRADVQLQELRVGAFRALCRDRNAIARLKVRTMQTAAEEALGILERGEGQEAAGKVMGLAVEEMRARGWL